jgi:citronellol/citronellal dehydrogenase
MGSLDGKVAFLTGASRGLGYGMAVQLAKAGAAVVCAARATDEQPSPWFQGTVDDTVAAIRELGGRAIPVKMDVTNDEEIERAFKLAFAEFGRIDFLINNAGVGFMGTVAELPVKRWDVVMNVNLRGAYVCCKQVLDHMMERRSHTSSTSHPPSRA